MLVVVGMEAVFLLPLIWGLAMEVVASCWHGGSVPVALNLGSGHGGCCLVVVGMEAVFLLPLIWGLAWRLLPVVVGMEAVFLLPLIWGLAMEVVASCCWHAGSVPVALNLGSGHGGCC